MNRTNKNLILLLLITVIALGSFLIYIPALNTGFIWDDIVNSQRIGGENPYSFFLGGGLYYRPLVHLFMYVDYKLWDINPIGYHLTNILLHMINSLLVFIVGFHLLKRQALSMETPESEEKNSKKKLIISFAAAMLFAFHPIHTESVAWIAGRTDILSTLFFLLAFLSYMLYERERKVAALVLSGIFFLFSLFAKENAIALIGIVFVYGLITKMPKKKVFFSLALLLSVLILYFILRDGGGIKEITAVTGSGEAFFSSGITLKNLFRNLFMGTGYYFEKLLLPFNLNLLPAIPGNPVYFLFFLLPFVTGGILYFAGKRTEFFLVVWILVTLLPSLAILFSKMANPLGERYLYLPSAGFCMLLALLLVRIKPGKAYYLAPFLIILAVYAVSTQGRLNAWRSDTALWENTVMKSPQSLLARTNYASSLLRTGNPGKAKDELLIALKMKGVSLGDLSTILYLLGEVELDKNNYAKTEEYFINASKADPGKVAAYNGLGFLYFKLSGLSGGSGLKNKEFLEKAIKNYEHALKLSPNFLKSRYYLALSYLKQGDLENAEKNFKSVIEIAPERTLSANAVKFLMLIRMEKNKKINQGIG